MKCYIYIRGVGFFAGFNVQTGVPVETDDLNSAKVYVEEEVLKLALSKIETHWTDNTIVIFQVKDEIYRP